MTYCERKHKHYKQPYTNAIQTPQTRRTKYHIAKALTHNTQTARNMRDFAPEIYWKALADYLNKHGALNNGN